jgi:hypothetical protein
LPYSQFAIICSANIKSRVLFSHLTPQKFAKAGRVQSLLHGTILARGCGCKRSRFA